MTSAPRFPHAAGLLLAGGRSRRFGAEKAVASFRGHTLMEHVAARFWGCAAFAVSARAESAAAQCARGHGWPVLQDDPAHPQGPLAGVCAGLTWARANGMELLAVAPCDAPLLSHTLFTELERALGSAPAAYAVTPHGAHPLCAMWCTTLLAPLSAELDAGRHPAVRDFLAAHGAATVRFGDAASFVNFNTRESLGAMESAE